MDTTQFSIARQTMVDCQIRPTKVTDPRVLEVFGTIPREAFVGKHQRAIAYVDEDLPLPGGRCMMEPMVLARLIQALDVRDTHNTLVIAGATGYGTAVLSRLAASVISVETRSQMVDKAQETLVSIGVDNAVMIKSRLTDGYANDGPYDRILVEGAVETMPDRVLNQLSSDGVLAAIWRPQGSAVGVASLWSHAGGGFNRKSLFDAQVPLLDEFRSKREFVF